MSEDLVWNEEKQYWISADGNHDVQYLEATFGETLNVKGWSYSSPHGYYVLPVKHVSKKFSYLLYKN